MTVFKSVTIVVAFAIFSSSPFEFLLLLPQTANRTPYRIDLHAGPSVRLADRLQLVQRNRYTSLIGRKRNDCFCPVVGKRQNRSQLDELCAPSIPDRTPYDYLLLNLWNPFFLHSFNSPLLE